MIIGIYGQCPDFGSGSCGTKKAFIDFPFKKKGLEGQITSEMKGKLYKKYRIPNTEIIFNNLTSRRKNSSLLY